MNLEDLRNYDKWFETSPDSILRFVKKHGGWRFVFPGTLPRWAHQIRNYFNIEPTMLTLLDQWSSFKYLKKIGAEFALINKHESIRYLKNEPMFRNIPEIRKLPDPPPGPANLGLGTRAKHFIGENFAVTGDVYKDQNGRIWLQMSPGGTIYHFKDPTSDGWEAFNQSVLIGQALTPVFKLVSPDGTGGSSETIIENKPTSSIKLFGTNYRFGRPTVGDVNVTIRVESNRLTVTDEWFQGSYNYSETIVAGFEAHQRHDIDPHVLKENHKKGVYRNPPNRFQPLSERAFPPKWWLGGRTY